MKLSLPHVLLLAATLAVASASVPRRLLSDDSIAVIGNNCNTNRKYPVMCLGQKCCKAGLVCHWKGECVSIDQGKVLCGTKPMCNGACCPHGQHCTTCGSCQTGDGPTDCEMEYAWQGYSDGKQIMAGGQGHMGNGKWTNAQPPSEYPGQRQGQSDQQQAEQPEEEQDYSGDYTSYDYELTEDTKDTYEDPFVDYEVALTDDHSDSGSKDSALSSAIGIENSSAGTGGRQ